MLKNSSSSPVRFHRNSSSISNVWLRSVRSPVPFSDMSFADRSVGRFTAALVRDSSFYSMKPPQNIHGYQPIAISSAKRPMISSRCRLISLLIQFQQFPVLLSGFSITARRDPRTLFFNTAWLYISAQITKGTIQRDSFPDKAKGIHCGLRSDTETISLARYFAFVYAERGGAFSSSIKKKDSRFNDFNRLFDCGSLFP